MDIESERIYYPEQIKVPHALPNILRDYTKAIIRKHPTGAETDPVQARLKLYQWSAEYFRQKLGEQNGGQ